MLAKLNPIIQRFFAIALILNGILLGTRWFENANPNKDEFILWIAGLSIVVGLAAFFMGLSQRRTQHKDAEEE